MPAVVRSGQVMGHLPFLGFRWFLKDMASCIDTQRSLALDWSAVTTIFHYSNYPLLKKIHVI